LALDGWFLNVVTAEVGFLAGLDALVVGAGVGVLGLSWLLQPGEASFEFGGHSWFSGDQDEFTASGDGVS
jgi:hypothetical protein